MDSGCNLSEQNLCSQLIKLSVVQTRVPLNVNQMALNFKESVVGIETRIQISFHQTFFHRFFVRFPIGRDSRTWAKLCLMCDRVKKILQDD